MSRDVNKFPAMHIAESAINRIMNMRDTFMQESKIPNLPQGMSEGVTPMGQSVLSKVGEVFGGPDENFMNFGGAASSGETAVQSAAIDSAVGSDAPAAGATLPVADAAANSPIASAATEAAATGTNILPALLAQ